MPTNINQRDNYESWTSDVAGATVFMEIYNPPQNGFAAKHLLRTSGSSVQETLRSRNLSNVSDAEDLGDKMLAFNLKLKATKDEPSKKTKTNTMIDCSKINVKTVAAKFAEAIVNHVGVAGADAWYDGIEVDLGTACVITEGGVSGVSTKIKIGGTKVGTSNKAGKTFLSFKVDHCGGA
jgi:hypothetical protein